MQKLHEELKTDIEFLSYRLTFYHNQHYMKASMLKERDKVYLLQKNIKTTRSSKKLNYVKIKSLKIIRNIKNISFKLNLLEEMKQKHLVFHVLLLKSVFIKVSVLR